MVSCMSSPKFHTHVDKAVFRRDSQQGYYAHKVDGFGRFRKAQRTSTAGTARTRWKPGRIDREREVRFADC